MRRANISLQDVFGVAEARVGIDGWKAYQWRSAAGGHIVRGAMTNGVYTRGKNVGRPRFVGASTVVVIGDVEMQRIAEDHERTTGECWDCKGSGQVQVGWSAANGARYESCRRCDERRAFGTAAESE